MYVVDVQNVEWMDDVRPICNVYTVTLIALCGAKTLKECRFVRIVKYVQRRKGVRQPAVERDRLVAVDLWTRSAAFLSFDCLER